MVDSKVAKIEHINQTVDWEHFLGRLDLDWPDLQFIGTHFFNNTKLSTVDWGESAFIGNGMVGAAIYKASPSRLKWELGRNDVEAHNFIDGVDWCIPRVPIGEIVLHPVGSVQHETMHLSLWNAEASGSIHTDVGTIGWRSFAHAKKNVIVIELRTSGDEEKCSLSFYAQHGVSPRLQFVPKERIPKDCSFPPEPFSLYEKGVHVSIQTFVQEDGKAEGECAVAWKEIKVGKNERRFFVSIENSKKDNSARETAVQNIQSVDAMSFTALESAHRDWWHEYYPQSFLSIPDLYWEKFYWMQMYKLAAATRGEMEEVIDNQGPWLTKTKWPGSWWNLNVQLSYSPLYKANRLNIASSLINSVTANFLELQNNAEPLGIKDGVYMGRTSGRKLHSPAPTYEEIMNSEEGLLSFEFGNFTWVLYNIWRHYASTMDHDLLRDKLYPMLRGNMKAALQLLQQDVDGTWYLPKLTSPEYPGPDGGTSYPIHDTNYDLALLRWGCQTLLEANRRLQIQDPLEKTWEDVLEHLVAYPQDENGLMVGRGVPFAQSHRHYSHLFPLYPLHLLDLENKEERALAEKSFQHWMGLTGALTGYSYTGGACMAATLGDGDQALEVLDHLKEHVLTNTLYVEAGGPVIETPISGAESIHYMVLQSWGGTVRTFPAVPSQWRELKFAKLLAEGGFEVTGSRKDGKNVFIYVKSLAGASLRIIPNLSGEIKTAGARTYEVQEIEQGIYEIDLKKGESILLYSGDFWDHSSI